MSTIPLAKPYTPDKLQFPAYVSAKLDGVPVRFDIDFCGNVSIMTRQGEDMPSIQKLVYGFRDEYMKCGYKVPITFVGEVVQSKDWWAPFKDTSGMVRRQYDQSFDLEIKLFDCNFGTGFVNFYDRKTYMDYMTQLHESVSPVYQQIVFDQQGLETAFSKFTFAEPRAEGMVARSCADGFYPGKRSWGYQKLLNEPTIDLRIVSFEEAIDKQGEPKGMVGRLVAEYKGNKIGIGPGKLTHKERVELWEHYQQEAEYCCCGDLVEVHSIGSGHSPVRMADYYKFPNRIAQIKYKTDDSYKALRQPTFQCWRLDKDKPDA